MSGTRRNTFSTPCSCFTDLRGLAIRAATALAQSIGEPPPIATIAVHLLARYSVTASSTLPSVGFGFTPSYSTYGIFSSSITFSIPSSRFSCIRFLSVTISALRTPFFFIKAGRRKIAPGPSSVSGIRHGRTHIPIFIPV